jgi:hypothetical protein
MIEPVLSSIRREGKMTYDILVDFVIELEEETETSMRKDSVRSHGMNVIV